eukprot:6811319-Pyramimonas_sp.AAC.1
MLGCLLGLSWALLGLSWAVRSGAGAAYHPARPLVCLPAHISRRYARFSSSATPCGLAAWGACRAGSLV